MNDINNIKGNGFSKLLLMNAYKDVFPTPNDLVEYLKYDGDDDGYFLSVAPDYNCFIDIYEKYCFDIDDDDLDEFDYNILLLMKKDLEELNYMVSIDNDNILSATLND